MQKIKTFPSKIKGRVKISGSKNASLPIVVASLLNEGKTILNNVPHITDINKLLNILKRIGINYSSKRRLVMKGEVEYQELLYPEIKEFRASYYLMGLFLALFKEVKIYAPGGCQIGQRPINFHLAGFIKAGVEVISDSNIIHLKANKLTPFCYEMPKKSLGATVNLLLLASKINGCSVIKNASTEPEVDDLMIFLNKLGIKTFRYTDMIIIYGKTKIRKKISYKIMPDRIEAMTFIALGVQSEQLIIKNINKEHLKKPLEVLVQSGLKAVIKPKKIKVYQSYLQPIKIKSGDYPEISTDQMPLFYPLFTRVKGISYFTEGIFESRFSVAEELKKTNADIKIIDKTVIIQGGKDLIGNSFIAKDLRAAATLLIEAVINGDSTIENMYYLERGYEAIYQKLKQIGLEFNVS